MLQNKKLNFDVHAYVARANIELPVSGAENEVRFPGIGWAHKLSDGDMPWGNGRIAGPVSIADGVIRVPLSHTDLFPFSGASTAKHDDPAANYAGGLARLYLDFGAFGSDVTRFVDYNRGVCGYRARDIEVTFGADMDCDVLFVSVDDRRGLETPVTARLETLRPALVRTGEHTAVTTCEQRDMCAVLTQIFTEKVDDGEGKRTYATRASIALTMDNRYHTDGHASKLFSKTANGLSMTTRFRMRGEAPTRYTLLIGAAVAERADVDTQSLATGLALLHADRDIDEIAANTEAWFANFWSRSYISLEGDKHWMRVSSILYVRTLYLMALSKRGKYPPLHQANPLYDATGYPPWGSRLWWYNQSRFEFGLVHVNHPELNMPYLDMVTRNIPAYESYARQIYRTKGICMTETMAHDGAQTIPERYAREIADLILDVKLPGRDTIEYGKRHDRFLSMWNNFGYSPDDLRGSFTLRMVYTAADLADMFRLHYLYSGDEAFLRERAYPMMRGAAEFYRNTPLLRKEKDGMYHIFPTNYAETYWGARDVIDDVAMISSLFPTVADFAERLGMDAELIPLWREIAANMCPMPTSDMPDALSPRAVEGKVTFAMCRKPCLLMVPGSKGNECGSPNDEQIRPLMDYDYVTLESDDERLKALCNDTLDGHLVTKNMAKGGRSHSWTRFTTNASRMARADLASKHILNQFASITNAGPFDGEDYPEATERSQADSIYDLQVWPYFEGLAEALMGCCGRSGSDTQGVIRIAPGWNRAWNARFRLAARGGMIVSAEIDGGKVRVVQIESRLGKPCVLVNPFGGACCMEDARGNVTIFDQKRISFDTETGSCYILTALE